MMIVMRETATEEEVEAVVEKIERAGARAHRSTGARVTVIGAIGDVEQDASVESLGLEGQPGVDRVVPILKPYKLASAQITHGERTVLDIEGRKIGGDHFAMIAGPCTVESREQTLQTARVVRDAGATLFRGGAYKPRTSPYAFQGLGQEGLRLLAEAKAETGLPIVTELMDVRDLDAVLEVADVIQIGARNMQNYTLLAEIGRSGRPALLKRGLSAPLDELLMAAEYILKEGNPSVMLCERGIRTFETDHRRVTLDLMAVPILKELSHLPVIVDPSHAAGRRELVLPLSLAAAAAGADGIIVETHPNPAEAVCDGPQALLRGRVRGLSRARSRRSRHSRERQSAPSDGPPMDRPEAGSLKVTVLGVGLIGGSIGLAARRRAGAEVCGYDPDARVRARALELGAIDTQAEDVVGAVAGAEVVFVAAPVGALAQAVREALAAASEDCVVSDVGSTKRVVADAGEDERFVGGHPLAGAETAGVEHAREDLFDGATWYLTPRPAAPPACSISGCTAS